MKQNMGLSSGLRPALQLWTVRELAERDMVTTLAAVAGMGYAAVEFAGFGIVPLTAIHTALATSGLRAISAHVPYRDLAHELDKVIGDLRAINCPQAIVPAFDLRLYGTLADARSLAASLNTIAARLHAAGLTFAYHNEADDFAALDGTTLWRALVDHTDPALVELQLDVFTAVHMGQDVIALMRDQAARITSLHVCDKRGERYVPIGQGELDWPALIAAARQTACRWVIVEHDQPPDPLVDAKASLDALTKLLRA
jgi:sugar phosphate isomerase/epimerase